MAPENNGFTMFVILLQNWFVAILRTNLAAQIRLRKTFDI
jgi:hypothetical protein